MTYVHRKESFRIDGFAGTLMICLAVAVGGAIAEQITQPKAVALFERHLSAALDPAGKAAVWLPGRPGCLAHAMAGSAAKEACR